MAFFQMTLLFKPLQQCYQIFNQLQHLLFDRICLTLKFFPNSKFKKYNKCVIFNSSKIRIIIKLSLHSGTHSNTKINSIKNKRKNKLSSIILSVSKQESKVTTTQQYNITQSHYRSIQNTLKLHLIEALPTISLASTIWL